MTVCLSLLRIFSSVALLITYDDGVSNPLEAVHRDLGAPILCWGVTAGRPLAENPQAVWLAE